MITRILGKIKKKRKRDYLDISHKLHNFKDRDIKMYVWKYRVKVPT